MEILKNLIRVDALLLALFAWLEAFGTRSRASEDDPALSLLGTGLLVCAVLLLLVGDLLLVGSQSKFARYLAIGNLVFAWMAFEHSRAYSVDVAFLLVLVPIGMAVVLFGASAVPLKPEDAASELVDLQIPDEVRQALLRQVGEAAAQEERNRLARDLHDSIKQQLFTISVSAATAQERWERDPKGAQTALVDVRRSAREAMVEMQAMLHQLRPQALTSTMGLIEALREQAEALGYRSGAQVTVELGPEIPDDRMPPGAREALFRIVQEALANVARHARAGTVHIWIGRQGEEVALQVSDDGQGFDSEVAVSGMGLRNLRERAAALQGRVEIEGAPGAGARVVVHLPLAPPPKPPETLQEKAIRQERGETWFIVFTAVMFLRYRPFGEDVQISDLFFSALIVLSVLYVIWHRTWKAPAEKEGEGEASLTVSHRASHHRTRAILLFCASWWIPWSWRLSEEGWTAAHIAGVGVALLLVGVSAFELVRFHRLSELRRGWRGFWRSSDIIPAFLVISLLLGTRRQLLLPLEIAVFFCGVAAVFYFILRQPREEGAPA
ncbi:MAG TPA: sensor histidine kinase [Thermoanaerobaculia bacterium]|nr:sensor histidine kinase [Thermoanaerobaculia bacterium]